MDKLFKWIKNKKILIGISIYVLFLITIQFNLISYIDKLMANVNDAVDDSGISYPVYNAGDLVYFDPVSENECNENVFSVENITNGTSTCYKWRVIQSDDSKTNETIDIQLDHNIGNRVPWLTSADRTQVINSNNERTSDNTPIASVGPKSALKELQRVTKNWTRVSLLNYEYDTSDVIPSSSSSYEYNYGKLTCNGGQCKNGKNEVLVENLRARLITPQELVNIAKKNIPDVVFYNEKSLAEWQPSGLNAYSYRFSNENNTQLKWLIENIRNDSDKGWTTYGSPSASGYWTLAPASINNSLAWDVADYEQLYAGIASEGSIGIRPVIKYHKPAYLVTYNDEERITKKTVAEKSTAPQIDSKGKQGHEFLYWSLRRNGSKAFDFDTLITKDITLYAVYNKNGCSISDRKDAVEFIGDLYENDKVSNNLEYDGTTDNNLRYINSNPNNYISFNNELWRIIGVFNVEGEDGTKQERLKIVRNEAIGKYSWDTSHHDSGSDGPGNKNSAGGINEWSQADLMYLLNPGYENHKEPKYYNDTSGKIVYDEEYLVNNSLYYNSSSGKCFTSSSNYYSDCDFTQNGIKEDYKKYIDTVKWYTGALNEKRTIVNSYDLYDIERSNKTGKDGLTKEDIPSLDNIERTTTWIGKIGLLYTTDTIFSSGDNPSVNSGAPDRQECFSSSITSTLGACSVTNNWLYVSGEPLWSITPTNGLVNSDSDKSASYVISLTGSSISITNYQAAAQRPVKPTLYLKPNVKITEGDGSQNNPYKIDFVEEPVCTVKVTYNDEERITNKTVLVGGKAESIESQGKTGYKFKYWSQDKTNEFDFDTTLDEDITLYAVYEIVNYTISYEGITTEEIQQLNNPTSYTIKSEDITLTNPQREGYTFKGWTGSNGNTPQASVTILKGSTGNKEYTANFIINKYDVEFYDEEEKVDTQTVDYNSKVDKSSIPIVSKEGYTFKGWKEKDKDELFDFDIKITKNYKLYSVYEQNKEEEKECILSLTSSMYEVDNEKYIIGRVPEDATNEDILKYVNIKAKTYEITREYIKIICDNETRTYNIKRIWIPQTGQIIYRYTWILLYIITIITVLMAISKQYIINKKLRKK